MDKYSKQIRNILLIIAVILIFAAFKVTSSVSINLVLSLFIFIIFLPICIGMEKAKVPPVVATIVSILLMAIVITVFGFFAIYSIDILIKTLPSYSNKIIVLDNWLISVVGRWVDLPANFSFFDALNIDWIGSVIIPALKTVSGSAVSITENLFITLLLTIFLLMERHTVIPKLVYAAKPENKDKVEVVFDRMYKQVGKYITIKVIISIITALLFWLICYVTHLDFAVIIAILTFVMNFIPNLGSILITIITIFLALLQFLPNWTPIIIIACGTISTQMILGNIIEPRFQGSQLNLSPFVILVALSVFGYIWGIVGTFLAVPILSVLEIILANMEGTQSLALILSSGPSFRRKRKHMTRKDS